MRQQPALAPQLSQDRQPPRADRCRHSAVLGFHRIHPLCNCPSDAGRVGDRRVGKRVVPRKKAGASLGPLPVSVFKPPFTAPIAPSLSSPVSPPADAPPVVPPLRFSAFSGPDEGLLEGTHLVVDCTLTSGDNRISTHSLLDCGATGLAFVHKQFVSQHNQPRYTLRIPRSLEVIDG